LLVDLIGIGSGMELANCSLVMINPMTGRGTPVEKLLAMETSG
jgi:hypothetical protein